MKLLTILLIPALIVGQTNQRQLSPAAKQLLRKPRLGHAKLTRSDGSRSDGRVLRVTNQFVTFESGGLATCENVDPSSIVDVQWPDKVDPLEEAGTWIGAGAMMSAFGVGLIAYAILTPIHHAFASPPLSPPLGDWEASGDSAKHRLRFQGTTVQERIVTIRRGHYSVDRSRLHITSDAQPETVSAFRFECRQLILDGIPHPLGLSEASPRVTAPIVGTWQSADVKLKLQPDGSFEERKVEVREGAFETTATGVRIHWSGGNDWNAQIGHRQLVFRLSGKVVKYHYVWPGLFNTE